MKYYKKKKRKYKNLDKIGNISFIKINVLPASFVHLLFYRRTLVVFLRTAGHDVKGIYVPRGSHEY